MSGNPPRAAGLGDRGVIAPGKRADVIHVRTCEGASGAQHPAGTPVPVLRGVRREGMRFA